MHADYECVYGQICRVDLKPSLQLTGENVPGLVDDLVYRYSPEKPQRRPWPSKSGRAKASRMLGQRR